jgi:hypothetical protein
MTFNEIKRAVDEMNKHLEAAKEGMTQLAEILRDTVAELEEIKSQYTKEAPILNKRIGSYCAHEHCTGMGCDDCGKDFS